MSKKIAELRQLSVEEINSKILELRTELSKERGLTSSGTKAQNPGKIGNVKKTISRLLTIATEKKTGKNAKPKESKTEIKNEKHAEKSVIKKALINAKKE